MVDADTTRMGIQQVQMITPDPFAAFARVRARWVILLTIGGFAAPLIVSALMWPEVLEAEGPTVVSIMAEGISYVLIGLALWGLLRRRAADGHPWGALPERAGLYAALGIPMVGLGLAGAYLLFLPLSYVAPDLVTWWLLEIPPTFLWRSGWEAALGNAASTLTLLVLGPVVEEVVFRGFLLHRWAAKYGPRAGIGLSAVCFGLGHSEILGAVVFAVVLSLVALRTRSLAGPIIVHMSNNALVGTLTLADGWLSGGEPPLTLAAFQATWWLGILGAAVGIPWVLWYYRAHLKARPTTAGGLATV